jgi:hypothetical protein
MKALATGALAVLIAGAVASAGLAAKPAKGGTLTLAAAPNPVTFGHAETLSGVLSTQASGVSVQAQAQPYPFTGGFKDVGTATQTTTGGAYSLTVTPSATTKYRVVTTTNPKSTSPEVTVAVRWRVSMKVSTRTPKKGARVRFHGSVAPLATGGFALIQRQASYGWATVKKVALAANATSTASTYSTRLRVRKTGRYRVQVAADASHAQGASRALKLRVH